VSENPEVELLNEMFIRCISLRIY